MKLVKEHINEKFTDESDPIKDMGIGMMHQIELFCTGKDIGSRDYDTTKLDTLLLICVSCNKYKFVKYLLDSGANVHTSAGIHGDDEDMPLRYAIYDNRYKLTKLLIDYGADVTVALLPEELKSFIKKDEESRITHNKSEELKDLILKTYFEQKNKPVNEKFTDESDPIKDMGIGSKFFRIKRGDIIVVKKNIFRNINPDSERDLLFSAKDIQNNKKKAIFKPGIAGVISEVNKTKNELDLTVVFFPSVEGSMHFSGGIKRQLGYEKGYLTSTGKTTYKNWMKYFDVILTDEIS